MIKKLLLTTLTMLTLSQPVFAGERMAKDDNQVYSSLDGEEYTILRQSDVLAVVEK